MRLDYRQKFFDLRESAALQWLSINPKQPYLCPCGAFPTIEYRPLDETADEALRAA